MTDAVTTIYMCVVEDQNEEPGLKTDVVFPMSADNSLNRK